MSENVETNTGSTNPGFFTKYASEISAGSSLAGGAMKAYGAYAAGKSQKDYYKIQSALNERSKAETERAIQLKIKEADSMREQADEVLFDAEMLKKVGDIKEADFQKQTDKGMSSLYAKMAMTGIAVNYGSPMDVIHEAATERAKDYNLLEYGNDVDYYHKKNEGLRIKEKATIMLDEAKVAQSNLPMFDYQSYIFKQSGKQAMTNAQLGMASAFLGAADDVFGDNTSERLAKLLNG